MAARCLRTICLTNRGIRPRVVAVGAIAPDGEGARSEAGQSTTDDSARLVGQVDGVSDGRLDAVGLVQHVARTRHIDIRRIGDVAGCDGGEWHAAGELGRKSKGDGARRPCCDAAALAATFAS